MKLLCIIYFFIPNTFDIKSSLRQTSNGKDEHFIQDNISEYNTYNLNDDYFQTTIMLYDTKIIENDTYDNLLNLLIEYPISITNDQGIIALYFTNIQPLFKQIKTHNEILYFYDYLSRNKNNKYIMLKSI